MHAPDRHDHIMFAKRHVPGERVLVIGVDERAIDVENHATIRHRRHPRPRSVRPPTALRRCAAALIRGRVSRANMSIMASQNAGRSSVNSTAARAECRFPVTGVPSIGGCAREVRFILLPREVARENGRRDRRRRAAWQRREANATILCPEAQWARHPAAGQAVCTTSRSKTPGAPGRRAVRDRGAGRRPPARSRRTGHWARRPAVGRARRGSASTPARKARRLVVGRRRGVAQYAAAPVRRRVHQRPRLTGRLRP